jgi:Protein of unknown function (DUF2911)
MVRSLRTRRLSSRAAVAIALVLAPSLGAQDAPRPRRSQQAGVVQLLGTTRVEVRYSRPSARGRELFGALVPWGRVWTPGADTATSVTFTHPVRVNGQSLAAGAYSLWTIPGEARWTIIFSTAHPVWHLPYPAGRDVLRIESTPREGPHAELLTFAFPAVDGLTGELVMHWGTTVVPIAIEAEH